MVRLSRHRTVLTQRLRCCRNIGHTGKTPEAGQPLRSPMPAARRTPHGHGPVRQRRRAPPWVFDRRRRPAAGKAGLPRRESARAAGTQALPILRLAARTFGIARAPTRFSAASWRTSSGPLAGGRAQRAGRSLDPRRESALSRHTPPAGHRAPALAAHADMIMVDSGPGPAGGHPRHSRKVSLPFGNAACTGQSGVETVIPLRAPASDANLEL
jgi:hypothetical protein